eukprot:TRINITY_DN4355_c0_g1_i3.p1 TRINITY_DN4355_c0_g1~~TRINITY_DN4355_c0_g1_i3.p1  ORF type:complete len:152 (+),score=0.68 TRINITY_DN4355_c0_g1_i3:806-1261(+)
MVKSSRKGAHSVLLSSRHRGTGRASGTCQRVRKKGKERWKQDPCQALLQQSAAPAEEAPASVNVLGTQLTATLEPAPLPKNPKQALEEGGPPHAPSVSLLLGIFGSQQNLRRRYNSRGKATPGICLGEAWKGGPTGNFSAALDSFYFSLVR